MSLDPSSLDPNTPVPVDALRSALDSGSIKKFHILSYIRGAYDSGFLKGTEGHEGFYPHFMPPEDGGMSRARLDPDELLQYIEHAYKVNDVGAAPAPAASKAPAARASTTKAAAPAPAAAARPSAVAPEKPATSAAPAAAAAAAPVPAGIQQSLDAILGLLQRPPQIDEQIIAAVDESVSRNVAPLVEGQRALRDGQVTLQRGQRNIGEALCTLAQIMGESDEVIRTALEAELDDIVPFD